MINVSKTLKSATNAKPHNHNYILDTKDVVIVKQVFFTLDLRKSVIDQR